MLTILIFILMRATMVSNISYISMQFSIFELTIIEPFTTSINSSAPTMWLVIFVDHTMVIVIVSTYLYIPKLFDGSIFWRLFAEIILILSINILYNNWSFFFEYCCRFFIDLRIFIEFILHFFHLILFNLFLWSFYLFLNLNMVFFLLFYFS